MKHRRAWPILIAIAAGLGGCAETQFLISSAKRISSATDEGRVADATPGRYKVGAPYKINDAWYYPKVDYEYNETGIASWYGPNFHGRETANGETFDMNEISAAHKTLPMPSVVRVTNLKNGRSLMVRVNDRGPFARGRIIDLSRRAAQLLGFERAGTTTVRVRILSQESRQLAAAYGFAVETPVSEKPPAKAAPRVAVTSESLAPPPGAKNAPPPTTDHKIVAVETAPERDVRTRLSAPVVDGKVSVVQVAEKPNIFVQVGAFTEYDNANKMRARLSLIGPADIYQVREFQTPFFRVRLGPLETVTEADNMLATVIDAGMTDAQIVVD